VAEANQAYLDITGYSREDLLEKKISWRTMTPPEYDHLDARAVQQLMDWPQCSAYQKEYIRKDGTRVPVLVGGAWDGPSRNEIISYAHDLTDQKRLEQQFQQSQRLESIGRLAGGVAHDFNNILGVILLYLEDMKMDLLDAQGRRDRVESITKHVKRAIRLTKQLLAFGRRQTRAPKDVQLSAVIEDLREMLTKMVPENVQVEFHFAENIPFIRADVSQLEQVLLNLLTNARDAIKEDGRIDVRVEHVLLNFNDLARLQLAVEKPGAFVRLSVKDSGAGIPENVLPHLYEPFFTTKEIGKGTGLGLATVYGIARDSGGAIRVETKVGLGTTFEVYFPISFTAIPLDKKPKEAISQKKDAGLILVVEDQPELLELMRGILSEKGFTVITAKSGPDALNSVKGREREIDLVVSDVIMPRMSGPAFVRELESARGGPVPALFVSGYPEEELTKNGIEPSAVTFLEKPFSRAKFLEQVRAFFQKA
jgi:two-component system cell cycle sensor histidine kinase/response regulator CckA